MNKETIKFYERQIFYMNISMVSMFLLVIFLAGTLLYSEGELDRFLLKTYDSEIDFNVTNLTIDVSDLSEKEQKIAVTILNDIKLIYLTKQKEIMFTKNISEYYTGNTSEDKLRGFNTWDGKNYIKYTGNVVQMRRTISHELIHSYVCRGEQKCHDVVYDLAKTCPALVGGCNG